MNVPKIYDLSFVSKEVSESGLPEIVIMIPKGDERTLSRLMIAKQEFDRSVCTYLRGKQTSEFSFGHNGNFGYKECGLYSEDSETSKLTFAIDQKQVPLIVATLWVTLSALNSMISVEGFGEENEFQALTVELDPKRGSLTTEPEHELSGKIFPIFKDRFEHLVSIDQEKDRSILKSIRGAMNEVCGEIDDDRDAYFIPDIHQIFWSVGDVINTYIYTENDSVNDIRSVRYNTHGLSEDVQQLALIAGLAKMVDLVDDNESCS